MHRRMRKPARSAPVTIGWRMASLRAIRRPLHNLGHIMEQDWVG
jgi:hypothetical protein